MKQIVAVVAVALVAGMAWGRFMLPIEMEEEQRHEYLLGGSMRWKYGEKKGGQGPTSKKGATNGTVANTANSTNYVSCHLQLFKDDHK
jgi:hypothetical protein